MDESSIFIQQGPNFQFLSACHYITILGVYFYNNDLIKLEERSQSVPVLNTLFDYIDKSENKSQAKYQILKKVLKGSDLYGGGENETLDMKYVEETYQYIISTVLFSHYGNINEYLAKIINEANNVNYSAFKEMILRHLSEKYTSKEHCSNGNYTSKLTPLLITKIYQDHILPIFPEPEEDMSILDISYIYAMVGLKIVKSITAEVTNFTFHEYVLISREIDLQDLNDETNQMVLKLFQIPALFFYSFNQKEKFRTAHQFSPTDEFWHEAYEKLFAYINSSMHKIVNENIENSLYNKLEQQFSKLQSRTHIAATILQLYCKYQSIEQVPELYVSIYKTLYKWLTILYLPTRCDSHIPDLETVYNNQFKEVEKTYNEIERNSIEKVLKDSKLLDIMDLKSIVKLGQLPLPSTMGCHLCSPIAREMNKDIYLLFTIIREDEDSNYYVLRQENNTLSLLSSNGNEPNFAKAVANDSSLKMDTGLIPTTLKFKHEDHKLFVQRVAEIKTKQFISALKMYYYEETLGEKYLNFFKSLIPFYNCIESATAGRGGEAAFSCTLDVFSLIPFAGLAAKYTTKITTSLSTNIGNMFLMTNTLAKTGIITKLPLMATLKQIAKMAARTIAEEILNRNLVKDLVVTSLRTLDPGFELFYKMTNVGVKAFRNLFQNMLSKFKNVPAVKKLLSFLKSFLRKTKDNIKLVADQTGLVPMILARREGYDIVRYFYPGGSNFFGPSCVSSLGRSAELRTIEGSSTKIPVLAITNPDNIFYKQYIPETGEILKSKLKMDKNDVLYRIGYLLDKMVLEGRSVNILRNYHVYHNTMDWKKAPTDDKPNDNSVAPTEGGDASLDILESLVGQVTNREYVMQQNYLQFASLQLHPNLQGSAGNYPPLANSELATTSGGTVQTHNFDIIPNSRYNELNTNIAGRIIPHDSHSELPGTSRETLTTRNYILDSIDSVDTIGLLRSTSLRDLLNTGEKAPPVFNKFVLDTTATGPNAIQIIHPKLPPKLKNERFLLPKSRKAEDEVIFFGEAMNKEKDLEIPEHYIHKKFDIAATRRTSIPLEKPKSILQQRLQIQDKVSEVGVDGGSYKTVLDNQNEIQDANIPTKIRKVSDTSNIPERQFQGEYKVQHLDNIPGTSKQILSKLDPLLYKRILKEPTYSRYVNILMMWKNYGLIFIKQDKIKINFLRTSLNRLALLQTEFETSLKRPLKLWYTQVVKEQQNINFLRSLKGKHFFFNDITLLRNKPPGRRETDKRNLYSLSTEVRYHITFHTPHGLVDLANFNDLFQDYYVTFNDIFFEVKDTFFSDNYKILNIDLKSLDVSRDYWKFIREEDRKNLLKEEGIIGSSRMNEIVKAANFMSNNALLCTFESAKDFLSNFILRIKPGSSHYVPSYEMLANEVTLKKMLHFYDKYKIESNTYIQDVLTKKHLDGVIGLPEAVRRIREVYDYIFFQGVEEIYRNFRKIPNAEERFRFEDYYVLCSYVKNSFLSNTHGMRRLEAAINRLALRQCEDNWIPHRIVLYRGEFITKELAERLLKSFHRTNNIAFGTFKSFSPSRDIEIVKFLNNAASSSQIPLLIEINVKNQAGIVDLGRALNEDVLNYLVTSDLEFSLQSILFENIHGQEVLKMNLEDYENPTEVRMVKMANNLHQLFSKDTKFYSHVHSTF